MADKSLLVPGTQATTLRDQNGTVYNAVRVSLGLQKDNLGGRPPEQWQDLLSVKYEPGKLEPTRTSLLPDTDITAGPTVMSGALQIDTCRASRPDAYRSHLTRPGCPIVCDYPTGRSPLRSLPTIDYAAPGPGRCRVIDWPPLPSRHG